MRTHYGLIAMALILVAAAGYADSRFDVRDYGAKGDGATLDSAAVQAAIDAASAAGGGTVVVSPGTYKVAGLVLKDNVDLHVEAGATLLGSPDIRDYPEVIHKFASRTNKLYAKHFVIVAEGAKNIAITGKGVIHGNGDTHFQEERPQNLRPYLVRLVDCEQVTIRDVQMLEAANWTCHLLGCRNVLVDGLYIYNKIRANRDGLDIDSCQDVTVSNCRITSGDDAIVIKSTCDVPCRNLSITNCQVASLASGIKIGTESNGDFKNITVSNCIVTDIPVHTGIELMTVDGATMENVTVDNIVMENVAMPIFVRLGNRARPYKQGQYVTRVATAHDISFSNIYVINAKLPCVVAGLNMKRVENISFDNISVRYAEPLAKAPMPVNEVPLNELGYPMGTMFGKNLPAYGFYGRNVAGLYLTNVRFFAARGETRPAIILDRVHDAELHAVRATASRAMPAMIHLRHCRSVLADTCRSFGSGAPLFEAEMATCRDLRLEDNLTGRRQKRLAKLAALQDRDTHEPIEADARYDVTDEDFVKGLPCHDLAAGPLQCTLDVKKENTPQVCILVMNTGREPEDVVLKYHGMAQEMRVDWHTWGWAPIALSEDFTTDQPVTFEVAAARPDSHLKIARVYLRYLQLGYTD